MKRFWTILFGLALIFAAPASADDGYRLGAGDRVKITVFDEPDLSGEFELDGGGGFSADL